MRDLYGPMIHTAVHCVIQVEIKKAEPKKPGGDAISFGRANYAAGSGNAYGFGGDAY